MDGKKIVTLNTKSREYKRKLTLFTSSWDTDAQTVEIALYYKATEE